MCADSASPAQIITINHMIHACTTFLANYHTFTHLIQILCYTMFQLFTGKLQLCDEALHAQACVVPLINFKITRI